MFKKLTMSLLLVCLLSACQTTKMLSGNEKNGHAKLVFMRSAFVGQDIDASLFDVTSGSLDFIGVLSNDTKIAYEVEPGEHTFMVVGETAAFLKTFVAKDETYYAVVEPRMGFLKARFSFYPVRNDATGKFQYNSAKFNDILKKSVFVKSGVRAMQWARKTNNSVNQKFNDYFLNWQAKGIGKQQHATLNINDHL